MKKGSGADLASFPSRFPRELYEKLKEDTRRTKSRSIYRRLCSILDEYFRMKENVVTEK
jgi:hypothetical protein